MSNYGVAMIARNGAETMRRALEPFGGRAAEMAIILGGNSNVNTAAIARNYTTSVIPYAGPVNGSGALQDFGAARQQSFDALAAPWAVVVDTDDIWTGVETIGDLIAEAEKQGAGAIAIRCRAFGLSFLQSRIFRRDAGHWKYPVHEYFALGDGVTVLEAPATLTVRQERRSQDANEARVTQNIQLALRYLETHPDDARMLEHLTHDLITAGRYEEALETNSRALEIRLTFGSLYHRAGVLLLLNRPSAALPVILDALKVAQFVEGYALLAEILYRMGQLRPALALADVALETPPTRDRRFAGSYEAAIKGTLQVKASAAADLGLDNISRSAQAQAERIQVQL